VVRVEGWVRILAIVGSVARHSSNSRLVHAMATAGTSGDVQVRVWQRLERLPYFMPDADGDPEVANLRQSIASADAVWIATPEYAGGMPGALKNALDWLVGSGELYGKPLVVLSAAPSEQRGGNARRWVEDVSRMQGAEILDSFTVALPPATTDVLIGGIAERALARAMHALTRSDEAESISAGGYRRRGDDDDGHSG